MFVLLVAQTQLSVFFVERTGEVTSALAAKDGGRFRHATLIYALWLAAAVPVYVFFYFVRETLALRWRRWLTKRTLKKYFSHRAFYRLTWQQDKIDNPDQRISEDIRNFTQSSLSFLLIFVGATFQLGAFSHKLWGISHGLVFFLLVYATFGTIMTVFSKPLVNLNFAQLRREADFRFGLVRVRENAESIAFYCGEEEESAQVRSRFNDAFHNYTRILRWTLGLNSFQWSLNFASLVIPSLRTLVTDLTFEITEGEGLIIVGPSGDGKSSLLRAVAGLWRRCCFCRRRHT